MLHPYIAPNIRINKKYATTSKNPITMKGSSETADTGNVDIPALVETAKKTDEDIVTFIGNYIPVRQVVL